MPISTGSFKLMAPCIKEQGGEGRVSIEIKKSDRVILEQFQQLIPYNSTISERTRTTNFAAASESAVWTVCSLDFRQTLTTLGLPTGRKSDIVVPPSVSLSEPDYFRGWVDANGSVGYTAQDFPFLSLTIASDAIAQAYLHFLASVTGKEKRVTRNARDNIFNIVVTKEDACAVVSTLYPLGCLALPRKEAKARAVTAWTRPAAMRRVAHKPRIVGMADEEGS